jgi:hypothetical protein
MLKGAMRTHLQLPRDSAELPILPVAPGAPSEVRFRVTIGIETDPALSEVAKYVEQQGLTDPRDRAWAVRMLLERHIAASAGMVQHPAPVGTSTTLAGISHGSLAPNTRSTEGERAGALMEEIGV